MKLSEAQRKQYEDDGYLVVKGVLSSEEVDRYKKRARELATGAIPPGAEKMLVRDVRVAKGEVKVDDPELGMWKLLQPDWYDPIFEPYPQTPAVLDVVEDIIGRDIKAFLTMMIYKPPGIQADHPYHQDSFYFAFGPHDLILGSWIALDPTDIENGTLVVIPGSHKHALIDHDTPRGDLVNFGVFGAVGYEGPQPNEVALSLEPGDGALFHSRLLHRTGPNTSTRHRRVLTVHFASAKCKTEGGVLPHLKFRLVRGEEFSGCI
ncbi:MAG: phytanoyl-CoA dioxygenase family protein [Candidatus Hydrogenedentes bacterium]|nr:phytanoyl-CoA dioxygenase family protein [Candidatus Hydrogenedentota bacterium]